MGGKTHTKCIGITDFESPFVKELIDRFQKLMICEEADTLMEMIQDYTELQCLNKASRLMDRYQKLRSGEKSIIRPQMPDTAEHTTLDCEAKHLFYELFVGREDTYSEGYMGQRRIVEQKNAPLTTEVLEEHLSGARTIGTYARRPNSTAKYLVLDIDISKKVLLKYEAGSPEFEQYMKICGNVTGEVTRILHRLGLKGYVEYSGYRGYHVWIFFTEWIPVRYVNALSQVLAQELSGIQRDEIVVEFFPDDRRMRPGKPGQNIKLPLGLNPRSGQTGYFLDDDFKQAAEPSLFLKDIARFSLAAVKKIVGMHMGRREEARTESEKNILDRDLDEFGKLSLEVRTVLENRNLMCYLCQKARKTGYLSHGERLSRPQRDLSIRFPRSRSAVLNCGNSTVRLRRRLAVPAILKEPKIVILHRFSMR